jgi:hypothetical protein
MTAQLDLFAEPVPPAVRYQTYWERMGRLPEVGDYVTPVDLFLTGGPGLVINGESFEGQNLYLTGECVRVTERLGDDLWSGVVDMGFVWGTPWCKDGWPVRFSRDDVTLTNRRPNLSPDPTACRVTA